MDLRKSFGLTPNGMNELPNPNEVIQYINLKLAGLGQPIFEQFFEIVLNFFEFAKIIFIIFFINLV